ncbi:MAG: cytochrome c [Nitrospirota bacterium]
MKIQKLVMGIGVLLVAGSWSLALTIAGNPENGRLIYERLCLRCHGEALDGKGPAARSLSVPPADFHAYSSRVKDDFELLLTIQRGRTFTEMHQWEDKLTDKEIRDVVAYIRSAIPGVKP